MKVVITYNDSTSFLPEEVTRQAEQNYGKRAQVTLLPDSDTPIDHLHFAVQRLMTGELLSCYYDSGSHFERDLARLKAEMMFKFSEVLDDVVNETLLKLEGEQS